MHVTVDVYNFVVLCSEILTRNHPLKEEKLGVVTLTLGSWPRQGLVKVWAKNETREADFILRKV